MPSGFPLNCTSLAKPPIGDCRDSNCQLDHTLKVKGVTNLFLKAQQSQYIGQVAVQACKLIGQQFLLSAETKQGTHIVAQTDAQSGEFKPFKIQQMKGQLIVKDFIDLGPAGIVLEVQL